MLLLTLRPTIGITWLRLWFGDSQRGTHLLERRVVTLALCGWIYDNIFIAILFV
jgi:hypothetical protein